VVGSCRFVHVCISGGESTGESAGQQQNTSELRNDVERQPRDTALPRFVDITSSLFSNFVS